MFDLVRSSEQVLVSGLHDLSVAGLAAAVITLGAVMLLELRSLARLRTSVDRNLARVFEQLDLLRFDSAQVLEARAPENPPPARRQAASAGRDARDASRDSTRSAVGDARRDASDAMGDASVYLTGSAAARSLYHATVARSTPAAGAVAAGETRLLAALAQARAQREQPAAAPKVANQRER